LVTLSSKLHSSEYSRKYKVQIANANPLNAVMRVYVKRKQWDCRLINRITFGGTQHAMKVHFKEM